MGEASSSHVAYLDTQGIGTEQHDLNEIKTRTRAEFPGWSVWRASRDDGSPGSWCATRDRTLTREEIYRGLARTLVCDNFKELRAELIDQVKCEEELD